MINRAAIILRYKQPAVKWVNDANPYHEIDMPEVSLEEINREGAVYLVNDEDADNDGSLSAWIEMNFEVLFTNELEGWYADDTLWPDHRTLEMFHEWFDVECHTMILDTVDEPIEDQDIEETLH